MEFLRYLERLNTEADAWIAREKGNCAGQGKVMKMHSEHKNAMDKMQREVDQLLKDAEEKAEKGDVTSSKQCTEMAKQKQEEITSYKQEHSFLPKGDQVCDVCGIRLNMDDMPNMQSHLNSNLHSAYVKTRDKAKELREKLNNSGAAAREPDENGVAKIDRRSRSRDRRRDRSRSRDRGERGEKRERRSRSRERRRR
eukprot:TRINITY_DN22862_c0_g1_i2.p1 TRINITY_DN22862_c0_g1~~TRINITY_DN22862_c0_g1_i2.p1  ORF type:complete len:197 (-),score=69.35 TRINITY_DN22862_c0_g1_i2:123-713(-)